MIEAPGHVVTGGILGLIAIVIAVAIAAGSNLALAIPAAVAAVALTTGIGLYSVAGSLRSAREPRPIPDNRPSLRFHRALAGDRMPREEVILLLDQVERAGPNPGLPSRPRGEVAAIVGLDAVSFCRYVAARIDRLERES